MTACAPFFCEAVVSTGYVDIRFRQVSSDYKICTLFLTRKLDTGYWQLLTIFAAVLASIVAVMCWNVGVAAIGPNRAGVFVYLIPVFTTIFAVAFLDEAVHPYHAVGFALILGGIVLTVRGPGARPAS